ncbi:MAG: pyrophosphokinae, partial [Pseudomonadota bacterium]
MPAMTSSPQELIEDCLLVLKPFHLGEAAALAINSLFGATPEIAAGHAEAQTLVEGVRRMQLVEELPRSQQKTEERTLQLERMRKMLLAMASDIRIVIIKLAERLVVLRTARKSLDVSAQQKLARVVLDLYAPLANRLGLWQIKWELEDLCLQILEPDTYRHIAQALDFKRNERVFYMQMVKERLLSECQKQGLHAEVAARAKHIYSIWAKLKRKGYVFEQLSDLHAVRIIVANVPDCYTALGVVHNLWTPVPSEFDDYIAKPKSNGYRSLHTAVVGPQQKVVEVQIRTREMHQTSEYGVAAHWLYKEGGFQHKDSSGDKERAMQEQMQWLRQLIEWNQDDDSAEGQTAPNEAMHQLKNALFDDLIFVLTPQGKVIDLPKGATAVDFAYALHTNLGHRCRGAKVGGV